MSNFKFNQFFQDNIDDVVIVSRHAGAIDWLMRKFPALFEVQVLKDVTINDVEDKIVVGNIPMKFAAHCKCVFAIEFDGLPPRSQDYRAIEMDQAGAALNCYEVLHIASRFNEDNITKTYSSLG